MVAQMVGRIFPFGLSVPHNINPTKSILTLKIKESGLSLTARASLNPFQFWVLL